MLTAGDQRCHDIFYRAVRHYVHMHTIEEGRDPRVKAVAKLVAQVAHCSHPQRDAQAAVHVAKQSAGKGHVAL